MDTQLDGKNFVITGTAQGIRRMITAGFVQNSSRVLDVDVLDQIETGEYLDSFGNREDHVIF